MRSTNKQETIKRMTNNFNKSRIIKNTILLYIRMLFTMWLNLYTTRLVLTNLGIEDMGVYGVVGSITNIFTVFVSGITNAIQRFITLEIGKNSGKTNIVFSTSLNILFIASIVLFFLLEVVGLWILNNRINIPEKTIEIAFLVFQFSILTCIINLISIPYNALIIAYEKMNVFALISIIQTILTCISAYCLSLFQNERLFYYSLLTSLVSILIRIIYQTYCKYKFKEAKYKFCIDKHLIKDISRYAGISTTSSILQFTANQGITFVINWTFGVTINAVYNIALQLKNSILSFSLNILKAISPQITKTYASGEIEAHKKLIYSGSKFEIYLIFFIIIPFLFKTEYIMRLWLGEVPKFAVEFAKCIVFISLTYSAFEPIRAAVIATGRIIRFMIIPDAFYILILPISYFISIKYNSPIYLIFTIVIMEIISCIIRIYYASKVTIIKIKECVKYILIPCFIVASISITICYICSYYITDSIEGLLCIFVVNSFFLLLSIYFLGINKKEKKAIRNLLSAKLLKYNL